MPQPENSLPRLELPKRWELLKQRAEERGLKPDEFVERVDAAAERLDILLRRVRTGGGGLFEVVFGLSGSGKTTFLQTLPRFFQDIRVDSFPKEQDLLGLPAFIKDFHVPDGKSRIVLVERRDNPTASDLSKVEETFGELLNVFREAHGGVLVLWPITKEASAKTVSESAWETGRDSMTDPDTRGLYNFAGIARERYFALADSTSRNLTGDGLEAFGVDETVAGDLLGGCDTIADFYSSVDRAADKQRDATWSVLKQRVRARVWVVLPGDDVQAVSSTVSALTQGTRNRIDIDRIAEFIDRPGSEPLYVADWKKRRAALAHLLRAIDVRLFGLPPNVSLAAIRSFGDDISRKPLKQTSANTETSKQALRATALYKAILGELGIETTPFAGARELKPETADEYRRVQVLAAKSDKLLNKALGNLLAACLAEDAPSVKVLSEKRELPGSKLQPDIQIEISPKDFICIEPTWRSTGAGVDGEIKAGQNTLAEGHMKQYVLGKATQFVNDLQL